MKSLFYNFITLIALCTAVPSYTMDTKDGASRKRKNSLVEAIITKKAKKSSEKTERGFICNTCNKSFINKCVLTRHTQIHTREKPHTCDMCGKGFTKKEHLRRHIRTHTREKPFICGICGTAFAQKTACDRHKKSPHVNKCPYCPKKFPRTGLKDHIKTEHPEQSIEPSSDSRSPMAPLAPIPAPAAATNTLSVPDTFKFAVDSDVPSPTETNFNFALASEEIEETALLSLNPMASTDTDYASTDALTLPNTFASEVDMNFGAGIDAQTVQLEPELVMPLPVPVLENLEDL